MRPQQRQSAPSVVANLVQAESMVPNPILSRSQRASTLSIAPSARLEGRGGRAGRAAGRPGLAGLAGLTGLAGLAGLAGQAVHARREASGG